MKRKTVEEGVQHSSNGDLPPLLLQFDVNKTILMDDRACGLSRQEMLVEVLASATYGEVKGGSWTWAGKQPNGEERRPPGQCSYYSHLMAQGHDEAERRRLLQGFCVKGGPGEGVAPALEELQAALALPDDERGREYCKLMGVPLSHGRFLVASFFSVLLELRAAGRCFGLVFRTFGQDIDKGLVTEFNAFCEGRHPFYPGKRFDGSPGGHPDLRIDLRPGSPSHGSFYRTAEDIHLVLGTLERPPPDNGLSDVGLSHFHGRGLQILHGHANVRGHLLSAAKGGVGMALRDYYPFWKAAGHASHGGKVFYAGSREVHEVILDDNVREDDLYIIDARDADGTALSLEVVQDAHVIRADPFAAITDEHYFAHKVAKAEQCWRGAAVVREG